MTLVAIPQSIEEKLGREASLDLINLINDSDGVKTDHLATKEDLKQFATKEDLKQFATKEDLKRYATKEDLAETKSEILKWMFAQTFVILGFLVAIVKFL